MAVAQDKMTKVCIFLERHFLPPTPLNFQVVYTYISQVNDELNSAIERAVTNNTLIDCLFIEQLYFEHLNLGHNTEVAMIENVNGVINALSRNANSTEQQIVSFAGHVSECMHSLDENSIANSRVALQRLNQQTTTLLTQHKKFKQALTNAKQLHETTKKQLNTLRKQHVIDPQTGLYKRHYLTKQVQLWANQQKSVCAIAIQINNLDHFIDNFGDVIGEVILNKVAKQVQKYVFQSGLAGRTAKAQFTVVVADIDYETTQLIAEKVRSGVEKLRFISSKSAITLPAIELSLGIAKQQHGDFNELAKSASNAAFKAHSLGQSSFIAEH
ncbi:GGDEF domain-containing protein [Pseudoalteromonas sp.]|uniref:GGDEF domain-containing protein n=1 Tax=Pseudoalteromonas sp. TaxID=53249 RepID=UPI00356ADC1E